MVSQEKELERFECVREMRSEMNNSEESTKKLYAKNIIAYMRRMNVTDLDVFVNTIKKEGNGDKIIRDYLDALKQDTDSKAITTNTASSRAQSVIALLKTNGVILTKRHRVKHYPTRNLDIPSEKWMQDLIRIADTRARALILIMASSGMRLGEVRELTLKNVRMNEPLIMITLDASITKGKRPRRVFISGEAKRALEAYLTKRHKLGHTLDDNAPLIATKVGGKISANVLWKIIKNVSDAVEITDSDKCLSFSPHTLRRFFITMMISANVPMGIVNYFVGHVGYLSQSYEKYRDADLAKEYLKGEDRVTILEKSSLSEDKAQDMVMNSLAELLGVTQEEVKNALAKSKAKITLQRRGTKGMHIGHKATPLLEVLGEGISKGKAESKRYIIRNGGDNDKVVTEAELGIWLSKGWRYISKLD